MWSNDRKCGKKYPMANGAPSQCDPNGDYPCCSNKVNGRCVNTTKHCSCRSCTNYTRLYQDWEESGGRKKTRYDGKCGALFPLPDGAPGECDPDGEFPCCDRRKCRWSHFSTCLCTDCVDYRVVRQIRKSGENCTLARLLSGFLKYACFDYVFNQMYYRCIKSSVTYKAYHNSYSLHGVSDVCVNDPHYYQACGFNTEITNRHVLCGGYFCKRKEAGKHKYIKCGTGDNCKPESRHCVAKRDISICQRVKSRQLLRQSCSIKII